MAELVKLQAMSNLKVIVGTEQFDLALEERKDQE